MDRAIDECITGGLLEEFLKKHKAEAKEMSIFEYDQEKHMRQERKPNTVSTLAEYVLEGHPCFRKYRLKKSANLIN